ncbi:MAG: FAD:protein FMN transferase [Chloroflexota bacterium]|nr:FAD:protein FMN transferase [Chloroflexota bacterium]
MIRTTFAYDATATDTATRLFRAMGCQVEVRLVHDTDAVGDQAVGRALVAAEARFRMYEAELSRFVETSGLTRLNRAAGRGPVRVSPILGEVIQHALAAAEATGGMFDPTLGTVLAHLGYDRPFPFPAIGDNGAIPVALPHYRAEAWRQIVVNPAAGTVALPADAALDFGGIGKGWAVDRIVAILRHAHGVRGGLVNAGGDLRVWGVAPDGASAWVVGVEDPQDMDRDCAVVGVQDQAVATSSTAYRRWQRGDRWVHHLLDPRTGQSAATDLTAVTVVGPSAMWAEIYAKVALLHGMTAGRAYLESQDGYDGLFIGTDGIHVGTTGIGGYLR